jgi:hypothetical protein
MQAKGGWRPKPLKLARGGAAPKMPKGLSPALRREWKTIVENPASAGADEHLLSDFISIARMRDLALQAIETDGLLADKKVHPAWSVFRQCQQMLIRLRSVMLLTPKGQAELRASGALREIPTSGRGKPQVSTPGAYVAPDGSTRVPGSGVYLD